MVFVINQRERREGAMIIRGEIGESFFTLRKGGDKTRGVWQNILVGQFVTSVYLKLRINNNKQECKQQDFNA